MKKVPEASEKDETFDSTQSVSIDALSAIMHWTHLDYVRVILVSNDLSEVLMVQKGSVWDLPHFEYGGSTDHLACIGLCCRDFQKWLQAGDSSTQCFTAVLELLGDETRKANHSEDMEIRDRLILVECQVDDGLSDVILPHAAEWKKNEFVYDLLARLDDEPIEYRRSMEALSRFMQHRNKPLFDPRYRFGWFKTASSFLTNAASSDGADNFESVIQEHLSSSSTIASVNSSKGRYFLKAPALGSREVPMTVKIQSLFPECSAAIIRASNDLNCFVTKEFSQATIPRDETGNIVQRLGQLQLASISSLDELKNSGFPIRDMVGLSRKIKSWMKGEGIFRSAKGEAECMIQIGPELFDMCRALSAFNIPLALCHGDFSPSNATYEPEDSKKVLIYDWDYAHVGHPFCDLHRIDADAPQEVIDNYLSLWKSSGISISHLRSAYDLARKLGWMIRLWALEEDYNLRKHELNSFSRSVFFKIMHGVRHGLQFEDMKIKGKTSA